MLLYGEGDSIARNRRGNVAVIFAMCLFPLIAIAGIAIDLSLHRNANTQVQRALDMAGLAAMKLYVEDPDVSDDDLLSEAQAFFDSELLNFKHAQMQALEITPDGGSRTFSVAGEMPTTISSVLGQSSLPLSVSTKVSYGIVSELELAMVLDMSASMNNSLGASTRLAALQDAAQEMVDELISPDTDYIQMAIVPFAGNVRIDTAYDGSSWLDVESDRTEITGEECTIDNDWAEENCPIVQYECGNDGNSITCEKHNCDGVAGVSEYETCTPSGTLNLSWHGCVMSRPDPDYKTDSEASYTTSQIPGYVTPFSEACADEIVELTNEDSVLDDAIAGLTAGGETYIPTGLIWGLRALSDHAPLNQGEDISTFIGAGNTKALILMSDGKNSLSVLDTGLHDGNDQAAADALSAEICEEIKTAGVELYTIAFGVTDPTTVTMLETCATTPAFAYTADDADALSDSFAAIRDRFYSELAITE